MSEKICLHAWVSGKVQGVWFRANTREEALKLGLSGWVRNRDDGRVEVLVVGSREQVKALENWLHQGPPKAKVVAVEVEERPVPDIQGTDFKVF